MGLDEVRVWNPEKGWITIDDVFFVGEVYAVAFYNSESTYAIGGNFTHIIVGGNLLNISYLVVYDEVLSSLSKFEFIYYINIFHFI